MANAQSVSEATLGLLFDRRGRLRKRRDVGRVSLVWRTISSNITTVYGDSSFSARFDGRNRKMSLSGAWFNLAFDVRWQALFGR